MAATRASAARLKLLSVPAMPPTSVLGWRSRSSRWRGRTRTNATGASGANRSPADVPSVPDDGQPVPRMSSLVAMLGWVWQSATVSGGNRRDKRHWPAGRRHPTRRDGAFTLALFLLPAVVALELQRRDHHLDVATVTVLVSAALGLPVLWLTWALYRESRRPDTSASAPDLGQMADQLAIAVGTQWEAEARARRLNDPYPLPVSWEPADPSVTDDWNSLVKRATSGAGFPATPPLGTWAISPHELAGAGSGLVEVLTRVPTGRLVVLGEPGSGKTILMVRLVLDMLASRKAGEHVPILASIASWDPTAQDLRELLYAQLVSDHPSLAGEMPPGTEGTTQAAALIDSGLIMPILDGLDEIPEKARGHAISRINDALRPGEQLVVTCRTQQYKDALKTHDGVEVTLRAAAVQLRPLNADDVRAYLCADAAGPTAKARWGPVLAALGTKAPAGQALSSPLMVGLARAIYNPRPGELPGSLRDPAELCDPESADRAAVECLLFDAFIPAAYRSNTTSRWNARQAEKWLVYLARYFRSADIAWWQLRHSVTRRRFVPMTTVAAGGLGASVAAGMADGVTVGMADGATAGVVIGIGVLALAGAAAVILAEILLALAMGKATPMPRGLEAVSPQASLARDRRVALFMFTTLFGMGTAAGVVAGVVAGVLDGLVAGVVAGLAGLLLYSRRAAWPQYAVAKTLLAFHRRLPWRLIGFLADAHQRGILQQTGTVYQFRHIELQRWLATRGDSAPRADLQRSQDIDVSV